MDTENKRYEEDFNLDDIGIGGISKLNVFDAPMGPGRYDKGVIVSDGSLSMRTSNLMTGKKDVLVDGKYFNVDDFMIALRNYLNNQEIDIVKQGDNEESNKIIVCKRIGKKVSIEKFLSEIKEAINGIEYNIKVGDNSPKIKNQKSAIITFSGKGEEEDSHRGLFMLGNKGLQLSKGDYKLAADIEKALNEYMLVNLVTRKNAPNPNKEEIYIAKRTKKKYSLTSALIPISMAAIMAFSMKTGKKVDYTPNNTVGTFNIEKMIQVPIDEDEAIQEELKNTYLGNNVDMNKGKKFYNSSDYQYGGNDRSGEFGKGLRESGNYVIEYLSIINKNTGEIIKTAYKKGTNIGNEINKTLKDNNLKFSDVDIKVHIGGPVSGWIDINDIDSLKLNSNKVKINVDETYKVIESDFQGNINFKNKNGQNISINILDSNGYILPSNSIVVGSDGNTYRVSIDSIKRMPDEKIVTNVSTWDLSLEKALKGALVGTGLAFSLSALLAELTKQEEISKISKTEFESAKEKYEEKSDWKALKTKLEKMGKIFTSKNGYVEYDKVGNKKVELKVPNIVYTTEEYSRGGR